MTDTLLYILVILIMIFLIKNKGISSGMSGGSIRRLMHDQLDTGSSFND